MGKSTIRTNFSAKKLIQHLEKSVQTALKRMKTKGIDDIKSELAKHHIVADVRAVIKGNKIRFIVEKKEDKLNTAQKAIEELKTKFGNIPIELVNQEMTEEIPDSVFKKAQDRISKDFQKELSKIF